MPTKPCRNKEYVSFGERYVLGYQILSQALVKYDLIGQTDFTIALLLSIRIVVSRLRILNHSAVKLTTFLGSTIAVPDVVSIIFVVLLRAHNRFVPVQPIPVSSPESLQNYTVLIILSAGGLSFLIHDHREHVIRRELTR